MTNSEQPALLRQFRTLCELGVARDLTDGQLLERFATNRATSADLAFAALVERHGPMVWRACRSRLKNVEDAQDAFQATFLILLKKARSLWIKDSLGPWLHQVALRTARHAQAADARRQRLQAQAADHLARPSEFEPASLDDRERVLHAEIDRLPDRQRAAIVLCDLQGQTCEQAARALGRPVGTIKSWRSRGRDRLRTRLARAGLAPEGEGDLNLSLAAGLAARSLPASLVDQAIRAIASNAPASVSSLVQGVIKTMLVANLRKAALGSVALVAVTGGVGLAVNAGPDEDNRDTPQPSIHANRDDGPIQPAPPILVQAYPITLAEAIRVGLMNSELLGEIQKPEVRPTGEIVITAGLDKSPHTFKVEVMAFVRSIEQEYWELSGLIKGLESLEAAVSLGEQALIREENAVKEAHGSNSSVAEARQLLSNYRLSLVTTNSDVITSRRQLRNLLGLPGEDAREIIPTSPPTEAPIALDLEKDVAQMMASQPNIANHTEQLRQAEAKPSDRSAIAAQALMLKQVIERTTLSLSRFVLEREGNYNHFLSATGVRRAAENRLGAQRAFYEEGRISIDRYLDAVRQYTNSVMSEARSKANYNTSIAALEEAKGTLLDRNQIIVEFRPGQARSPRAAKSGPAPAPPTTIQASTDAQSRRAVEPTRAPDPAGAGRTYTFQLTLGTGPNPLALRGSLTVPPSP